MGQDILEQIYYGKVVPWENRNDRTPEMEELSERIDGEIGHLEGMLDDDGKALLGRLMEDRSDLEGRTVCEGFKDGFRLGAQVVLAALGSGKKP